MSDTCPTRLHAHQRKRRDESTLPALTLPKPPLPTTLSRSKCVRSTAPALMVGYTVLLEAHEQALKHDHIELVLLVGGLSTGGTWLLRDTDGSVECFTAPELGEVGRLFPPCKSAAAALTGSRVPSEDCACLDCTCATAGVDAAGIVTGDDPAAARVQP